ncbi:MAG TPA: hypothetical protein VFV50_10315 [Bdellovibrionales bacterium]|nr:hypothetical protein [Bdellovibrionales bacterium]
MSQPPPKRPSHLRELASQPCPRCGGIYEKGAAECGTCGLIFAKMKKPGDTPGISTPAALETAWGEVMMSFSDEAAHLAFIEKCLAANNALFASQKYRKLIEANPNDELAIKMRDKIIQRVSAIYMARMPIGEEEPANGAISKLVFVGIGLGAVLGGFGLMLLSTANGKLLAIIGGTIFGISVSFYFAFIRK